jgi:hypothetical protein
LASVLTQRSEGCPSGLLHRWSLLRECETCCNILVGRVSHYTGLLYLDSEILTKKARHLDSLVRWHVVKVLLSSVFDCSRSVDLVREAPSFPHTRRVLTNGKCDTSLYKLISDPSQLSSSSSTTTTTSIRSSQPSTFPSSTTSSRQLYHFQHLQTTNRQHEH